MSQRHTIRTGVENFIVAYYLKFSDVLPYRKRLLYYNRLAIIFVILCSMYYVSINLQCTHVNTKIKTIQPRFFKIFKFIITILKLS